MLAALSVVIRPTAVIIWVFLGVLHLGHLVLRARCSNVSKFVLEVLLIGTMVLALSMVVDRIGYGHWTMVQWNFFRLNGTQACEREGVIA